ncbi:MAG: hypothetical protein LJE68_16765, partial [Rhodobacter sp.]|nr:hypothetical protein [Rhodobacter sp.]
LRQNPVIGAGERQDFGLALATAALNAFRGNAAQLLGLGDSPLEKVASSALDQVLNGLASGIGGPDPLKSIFSRTQLVSLVETILKEAANQPGLLGNSDELRNIVTALASTIGSAQGKLLTPANWTSLAATVLQQAAINPGRLFGFDLDDPRQELATRAISTFLNQAAADLAGGRAGGGVLFGQTLMRAIETTLIGFVSNPANALKLVDGAADDNLLAALITQVSGAVRTRSLEGAFQFGAAQWQQIYSALLTRLLADTNARFGLVDASGLLTSGGRTLIVEILATVQPGTGATS